MRNYMIILVWFITFIAVLSLACDESTSSNKADYNAPAAVTEEAPAVTKAPVEITAVDQAPAETDADADSVAVTVNGVNINESQLEKRLKPQLEQLTRQAGQLPPEFIEQYKQQLRQKVLEPMIIEMLLDEQVKKADIVVSEEDVIATLEKSGSMQQPPLSIDDIKTLVESQGRNFEDLKKQMLENPGLRYQKLIEAQWAGKINVTDEDAQEYYSENPKDFETPEQVRVSHILIKPDTSDPNADPNDAKATAKAKAQQLLKQIKDQGADFAELAKANSSCPSSVQGGDLGLKPRGAWVPAFEKAAFGLEVGQVTDDVVETQFGYHIIKATERKDAGVITFDEAKDRIIMMLTQNEQGQIAEEYITSLKDNADIVYPAGKEPKPAPAKPASGTVMPVAP